MKHLGLVKQQVHSASIKLFHLYIFKIINGDFI